MAVLLQVQALQSWKVIGLKQVSRITKGEAGKAPDITLQCPSTAQTGKNVECAFRYSGKVESITWSASGGNPETGTQSNFLTQYGSPGTFQISLTACLGTSCSQATQTVVVAEASSDQH